MKSILQDLVIYLCQVSLQRWKTLLEEVGLTTSDHVDLKDMRKGLYISHTRPHLEQATRQAFDQEEV